MFAISKGSLRPDICSIVVLCFSAATLSAAPQLRLSTTAVGPVYIESGAGAPAQTVNAFNIGDGSLNLSVTSSASWLSGSLGASQTCTGGPAATCIPVNITLTTSGLAIGTHTESLTLTDPNSVDSPQSITVTVQVDGAPTSVNLYVTPAGGPSPTASVPINTGVSVKSAIKTSDNGPWLSFAVSGGGSYNFFTPYQLTATAQAGQSGNYSGTVTLTGSTNSVDNQTVNVNLQVTSQPILQISQLTYNLVQGQSAQNNNVTLQNIGLGALSITGVTASGGNWLGAAVTGSSSISITTDPSALTPGSYSGTVTVTSNAANTAVPIPIRVNVAAASGPMLSVGGVVDNAAFATGQSVGSGTIVAVFGSQLSPSGPTYAGSLPLPTVLAGVQVLVNGTPAPLFYVNANQADIQVPFGLTAGQMTVQAVRNGQPGNQISALVDSVAPRMFALRGLPAAPDSSPYGIVINSSDGTLALPTNLGVPAHPAHPGDVVTIYALGLGPVNPSVSTGAGAPGAPPLALTVNPVTIFLGGGFITPVSATPSYAGLAPNFVGLYQINVTIPAGAPTGNVPVMINMPGHASNFVEMAIAAN